MTGPRCAVLPADRRPDLRQAVIDAGGQVVDPADAEALIWAHATGDPRELRDVLDHHPHLSWVHLPPAGIERFAPHLDTDRRWTCGKGIYARPVAELALALLLAGFRRLHRYARATSWGDLDGRTLFDARVAILGGGGIASELAGLLAPFDADITVVRNRPQPIPNVGRVVDPSALLDVLAGADAVVLALALTPATTHIIGTAALEAMAPHAWLVNVARGGHVDTDALVRALRNQSIGGAALDVTDPEPLPDGHPLWELPNALVTPHTANPRSIGGTMLVDRVRENVRRFGAGEELLGTVDVELGY